MRPSRAEALALLVPFAVYLIASSLLGAWIIDDAGITFAYARNVAHGYGFVSQPGRPPVEGFSDALWMLLLVPFFALRLFHPVLVPKALGALFVLGSFRAVQRALSHATGRLAPGFFVALLFAASPPLVIWCASGLENGLVLFLVTLLYALAVLRPARWQLASGVVTGLLAMTRPECITLAAAGLAIALGEWLARRATLRQAAASGLAYLRGLAYVVVPFFALRLAIFQQWLPQTYYAKRTFLDASERIDHFVENPGALVAKLADVSHGLAGQAGPWVLGAIGIAVVDLARRRKLRAEVGAAAAILLVSLLTFLWMDEDWMGELRFGTPVVAAAWITAVSAGYALWLSFPALSSSSRASTALAALGAAICAGVLLDGAPRLLRFVDAPVIPLAAIDRSYAQRINAYADAVGAQNASVLCPDGGAMLMSSRLLVLDEAGLFEPDVVHVLKHDGIYWLSSHPDFYDWVFETAKPTFITTHDFWSYVASYEKDPRFARDYAAIEAYPDRYVEATYGERVHSGVWVRKDALRAPDAIDLARGAYQPPPLAPPFIDRLRAAFGVDPAGPHATDEELRALARSARFERRDPSRAAMILARLAERRPNDLDAHVELAEALDEAFRSSEARPVWMRVVALARAQGDPLRGKAAEDRLRGITPAWTEAEQARLMQAALDALYRDHDPARAVELLDQVLALNPDHYGANYQLAAALDAAGRKDEARALWHAVLDRARRLGDTKTVQDVTARIATRP